VKQKNRISFNGGMFYRYVKNTNRIEFYKKGRIRSLAKAYMMCTQKKDIEYSDFMTRIRKDVLGRIGEINYEHFSKTHKDAGLFKNNNAFS
jgi:hypothetical protein